MTVKGSYPLEERVAIVTDAGSNLGRAYSLVLAEHGAKVIANDRASGYGKTGPRDPTSEIPAVIEIRSRGGTAESMCLDVADPDASRQLVEQAVATFGRVDIVVINSTPNGASSSFADTTMEEFEHHWRHHLGCHLNMARAAWPRLREQEYGRIVMAETEVGLFGQKGQSSYAAASGAIHGLMRTLAVEGKQSNILANSVCAREDIDPFARAAPLIAWLASSGCSTSGQTFLVQPHRLARLVTGTGRGFVERGLTAELISQNYAPIDSAEGLYEPIDAVDEISHWLMSDQQQGDKLQ